MLPSVVRRKVEEGVSLLPAGAHLSRVGIAPKTIPVQRWSWPVPREASLAQSQFVGRRQREEGRWYHAKRWQWWLREGSGHCWQLFW